MSASTVPIDWPEGYNAMESDYFDARFNKYCSGPGENLELEFDTKRKAIQTKSYLVFRKVPNQLCIQGLQNLCEKFATVLSIRHNPKLKGMYFADFPTLIDLEAVYNALQDNEYGFEIQIGRNNDRKHINKWEEENVIENTEPAIKEFKDANYSNNLYKREYYLNNKLPPRPNILLKPIVTSADYENEENLLQRHDPHRHFLIAYDAYHLEREGYTTLMMKANDKYNYQTGRPIKIIPSKQREQLITYQKKSVGHFHPSKGVFRVDAETTQLKSKEPIKCASSSCSLFGLKQCELCLHQFCSTKCHDRIATELRTVCFREVEKQQIQQIEPEIKFPSIFGCGSSVIITSISSSNLVYICSNEKAQQLPYVSTICQLQSQGPKLLPLTESPKLGQLVIALQDNFFHRAMVLQRFNCNDSKFYVAYVDYGNIVLHTQDELYVPCNADSHFQQRFILPVQLKGVDDRSMTQALRQCFFQYLEETPLKLLYESTDLDVETQRYNVQLLDMRTNKTLNDMLTVGFKPVPVPSTDKLLFDTYLYDSCLPEGIDINLQVMDNSTVKFGFLSVTTPVAAFEVENFQKDLQRYAEEITDSQCFNPDYKELCIAKYVNQKWYRAYGLESVGDGHPSVIFLDYGNAMPVNVANIRPFAREFRYPIFTGNCELKGLPENIDDALEMELEKLLPVGCIIRCDRVEYDAAEDLYIITINRIISHLKRNNFISYLIT